MPSTVALSPVVVGVVNLGSENLAAGYLLQESGFKISLEDGTGFILLDDGGLRSLTLVPVVPGVVTLTGETASTSLTLTPKTVGSLTLGSP